MENKENTGAIFKNKDKKEDKHPDYKGVINLNGEEKDIALWSRTSKTGMQYYSVVVSDKWKPESSQNLNNDLGF